MAGDFAKREEYDHAASILKQYNDAVKASGAAPDPIYVAYENQYSAIAQKGGFSMLRPQKEIKEPIRYLNSRSNPGQIRVDIQLNNHTLSVFGLFSPRFLFVQMKRRRGEMFNYSVIL